MYGLIQDAPLLVSATLAHAARVYPGVEVVTADDGQVVHVSNYAQVDERARCLADGLSQLGLTGAGVFLGALGFNTWRMLEVMHAVPGSGAVLHTANPRLHADDLAYTIDHAGDRGVLVDLDCLALAETIAPACPKVRHWVILCDAKSMPSETSLTNVHCYEDLLRAGNAGYRWPVLNEKRASTLCFTSATTGRPKGVLYSHRGTVLNVMSVSGRNGWDLGRGDCVLSTAPFFHCNGWGMPYMAPIVGAKMVLPGRVVTPDAMLRLIHSEQVTHSGAVPTVLLDLLAQLETSGGNFGTLRLLWTGATAPSESLLNRLEALGPTVRHAFGMTETTQVLTISTPDPNATHAAQRAEQQLQGQPVFLSDVRVVNEDGEVLPDDGVSVGHLQVRGPAVASAYFGQPDAACVTDDGWLMTGDIGTVGAGARMRITDRAKDAIKSGGEWISSVALENIASGCPGASQAACIGVQHPRWQERPLLLVVRDHLSDLQAADMRAYLHGRIATWWMPDAILFVDSLPRNSVGKVAKADLRARYAKILDKPEGEHPT
jgi:acyl-CoA synthetase (AMP-forming)/AMP-acid ligase II